MSKCYFSLHILETAYVKKVLIKGTSQYICNEFKVRKAKGMTGKKTYIRQHRIKYLTTDTYIQH